jgi:hypothetical protein
MKEGLVTKHDLDRIVNSIEHEMEIKPVEKPRVVVKDIESDSDDSHIVDLESLTCTCKDFEFNCNDSEYCKHIFHVIFKKHRMI